MGFVASSIIRQVEISSSDEIIIDTHSSSLSIYKINLELYKKVSYKMGIQIKSF
jgi:hypothetical protein